MAEKDGVVPDGVSDSSIADFGLGSSPPRLPPDGEELVLVPDNELFLVMSESIREDSAARAARVQNDEEQHANVGEEENVERCEKDCEENGDIAECCGEKNGDIAAEREEEEALKPVLEKRKTEKRERSYRLEDQEITDSEDEPLKTKRSAGRKEKIVESSSDSEESSSSSEEEARSPIRKKVCREGTDEILSAVHQVDIHLGHLEKKINRRFDRIESKLDRFQRRYEHVESTSRRQYESFARENAQSVRDSLANRIEDLREVVASVARQVPLPAGERDPLSEEPGSPRPHVLKSMPEQKESSSDTSDK
jgi:hypothetical protein